MTRASPLRAVVFDLDGTLVDSLPLVLNAIAHALEPFGARPSSEIFAKLGGPPERFLPTLLNDARHTAEAMSRMDRFHRENRQLIRPFAGAATMLAQCRAAGLALAIWTGRDRESGTLLLREHALDHHFATVVFGDDLPTHKPDPAGLHEILRRLKVSAAETLYVGDADVDVLGGVGAGVDMVLIEHGRAIAEDVRRQAWQTVAECSAAYDLIDRVVRESPVATAAIATLRAPPAANEAVANP